MEKNNDDFIQKTYLKTAIAKKENPDEYDKDFLKNNKAVDQVMIKLPFSESNGGELKVWVFFLAVLTVGIIVGFFMGLIHIVSQKRENLSYKSKIKKLQLELDTLRNQSIDEDLVLKDDLNEERLFISINGYGGRYGNGQVRCQTCEIYMTENGASNGYCLCCNMRVRSKPRNSAYKEILRNNETNKPNNESGNYHDTRESLIDIQEDPVEKILDTVPMNNDYSSEKKSTPIYDEIDESVKTFYEFKEFLENDLRPRSNYQFVMLHELLTKYKQKQNYSKCVYFVFTLISTIN